MKTFILRFLFVALLSSAMPVHARDIVNLDGRNNAANNPVQMFFQAGTYNVEPIGIADGGAFNAVSLARGAPNTWTHRYSLSSAEFGTIHIGGTGSGPFYETSEEALDNAISSSFTLTYDGDVSFYIFDGPDGYSYARDNVGGVSLEISSGPPRVFSLCPAYVEPGEELCIWGEGFGEEQEDSIVHIGKHIPEVLSWSDIFICVQVKDYECNIFEAKDMRKRKVWVTVGNTDSNKRRLRVIEPDWCE